MVKGCIAGCERHPTLPMCRHCIQTLGAAYGSSLKQYLDATTRFERSVASPHGRKGTVRQKHQNKTFKYMRVKPVALGYNWALLRLKQIAGEARWEEAEIIRLQREQNALIKGRGIRLKWCPKRERYVKVAWRKRK